MDSSIHPEWDSIGVFFDVYYQIGKTNLLPQPTRDFNENTLSTSFGVKVGNVFRVLITKHISFVDIRRTMPMVLILFAYNFYFMGL